MEPWIIALIVLGVIGGISLIVWLVLRHIKNEKQRTLDLEAMAKEMSLSFFQNGDPDLTAKFATMSVMSRGHSRQMKNAIRGEANGVELGLFDYYYTTGHGKNQTRHSLTVAAFESSQLDVTNFTLGAENFMHRIANTFGYQDIDFAGYPTFNKKYLLRGPDEEAVRGLFTEDIVQFFEAQLEQRKHISEVEGNGSLLTVCTSRQKVEDLQDFLAHAFSIYGLLKLPEPAENA